MVNGEVMQRSWTTAVLGLVMPLALVVVILGADSVEGPKTAYVGVLAVVPMLAAVFATPAMTAIVGAVTWLAAFTFGRLASDGNAMAQEVRLVIIALFAVAAVGAAVLRIRRERVLVVALQAAARADELRKQAETDHLTGIRNRHGVVAALEGRASDGLRTLSLIDCDNLKDVNDRLGHLAGDEYLKAVAGRLSGALPGRDLVGRWGGDEFVVIQDLPPEEAVQALARAQASISGSPMAVLVGMVEASVSVGVAPWAPGETLDEALAAADRALYEAKDLGREHLVIGG